MPICQTPPAQCDGTFDDLGHYYQERGSDKLEVCLAAWYRLAVLPTTEAASEEMLSANGNTTDGVHNHKAELGVRGLHRDEAIRMLENITSKRCLSC